MRAFTCRTETLKGRCIASAMDAKGLDKKQGAHDKSSGADNGMKTGLLNALLVASQCSHEVIKLSL